MRKKQMQLLEKFTEDVVQGNLIEAGQNEGIGKQKLSVFTNVVSMKNQIVALEFEIQVVARQIQKSVEKMSQVFSEQMHLVDQTYTSSHRLIDANDNNIEQVDYAVGFSKQLLNETEELIESNKRLMGSMYQSQDVIGKQLKSLNDTIQLITGIEESNRTSVNSISSLSKSAGKIESIFDTVQDFYKQTELLALNASIESARAGDAGKGFAVVATEIQNLARKSSESTADIKNIMKEINDSIGYVVDASEKTSMTIQQTVNNSEQLEEDLTTLTQTIEEQSHDMQVMEDTLTRNVTSINQLTDTIHSIRTSSERLHDEVGEMEVIIQKQYAFSKEVEQSKKDISDASETMDIMTQKVSDNLMDYYLKKIENQTNAIMKKLETIIVEYDAIGMDRPMEHQKILDRLVQEMEEIEAVWSNRIDGSFIHSNPPNGIENANARTWFQESKKGKAHVSDVYISAISKRPCVTISVPIFDQDKKVSTILGVDITCLLT